MSEMKSPKNEPTSGSGRSSERRWGHPLLGFARFLAGAGFWISHAIIVVGMVAVLLLTWSGATLDDITATLATMLFGVALLFAFAGWIARCSR